MVDKLLNIQKMFADLKEKNLKLLKQSPKSKSLQKREQRQEGEKGVKPKSPSKQNKRKDKSKNSYSKKISSSRKNGPRLDSKKRSREANTYLDNEIKIFVTPDEQELEKFAGERSTQNIYNTLNQFDFTFQKAEEGRELSKLEDVLIENQTFSYQRFVYQIENQEMFYKNQEDSLENSLKELLSSLEKDHIIQIHSKGLEFDKFTVKCKEKFLRLLF